MLSADYEIVEGKYYKYLRISKLTDEQLERIKEIFTKYHRTGVIINDSYSDNVWIITDQNKKFKLGFDINKEVYYSKAYCWIGVSLEDFIKYLKAYLLFSLGKYSLSGIYEIWHRLKNISNMAYEDIIKQKVFNHYTSFLQSIPYCSSFCDAVIEELEEKSYKCKHQKGTKQRVLSNFNVYLRFNDIILDFWSKANRTDKLYYFPLYFWWRLTSILPLRVTEFLLIQRDCIEKNSNNEHIITIRRTKLKGGMERVTYTIDGDYEKKKYFISKDLADDVIWYIKETEAFEKPSIGTLLILKPKQNLNPHSNGLNHYSYNDLKHCLYIFYKNVVMKYDSELDRVNLGDTRHIAMVNLIISGGSPTICKELAGHRDIETSSNYYSNISNLVECMTLNTYRKFKGSDASFSGVPRYNGVLPLKKHRVVNGWCDAMEVEKGNVSECVKNIDRNGHIGVCENCVHYWSDQEGIRLKFFDEKAGKNKVDMDAKFLLQTIEKVRKGIGMEEDIKYALLKIQNSSNHYIRCLWEKYSSEETRYGTPKKI